MPFACGLSAGVVLTFLCLFVVIGGAARRPQGHQPKVPPARWPDNPFGGHGPPNRPVDPAKLVLPKGSGALPPRGR